MHQLKLFLLIPTLCLVWSAHAVLREDPTSLASAADIEALTQQLAACPELASTVAGTLDAEQGLLSKLVVRQLHQATDACLARRAQLTTPDRYRLAYSSLKALVADHVAPPRSSRPTEPEPESPSPVHPSSLSPPLDRQGFGPLKVTRQTPQMAHRPS